MRKAVLLLLIITKGVNCGFSGDGIVLSCGPALLRTAYNSQPAVLQVECSVRPGVFVWTTVLALVYYTGIQRPTFVKNTSEFSLHAGIAVVTRFVLSHFCYCSLQRMALRTNKVKQGNLVSFIPF
jgi:hypothetical protein